MGRLEGCILPLKPKLKHRILNAATAIPGVSQLIAAVRPREAVFAKAYRTRAWESEESHSGVGSEMGASANLRAWLPDLFRTLQVKSLLDAPCGDWNWMRTVDLKGIAYTGVDVVSDVVAANTMAFAAETVRFVQADLTKAHDLPRADLVLCRHCWAHLSWEDAAAMLENFRRSGSTYLLTTHAPSQTENLNRHTGLGWRDLNLTLHPFSFPPPIEQRHDHYDFEDGHIALWRIADLPKVRV